MPGVEGQPELKDYLTDAIKEIWGQEGEWHRAYKGGGDSSFFGVDASEKALRVLNSAHCRTHCRLPIFPMRPHGFPQVRTGAVKVQWGNPTPDTEKDIVDLTVISISRADGEYLAGLCEKGEVSVHRRKKCQCCFFRIALVHWEVVDVRFHTVLL